MSGFTQYPEARILESSQKAVINLAVEILGCLHLLVLDSRKIAFLKALP
jgi:hypothetical protein